MDARSFDALTVAITSGARRASRRRFLRGLAALAAVGLTPGAARALDGGPLPVQPAVGGVACTSGADCAAGEICLNGACAPRQLTGAGTTGQAGQTAQPGQAAPATGTITPTQPVATGDVPGTTPVTPPDTAPAAGVGGLIQPGEPLPARIYAGRCGSLGAEPAFQLIDVGAVEGIEEGEAPQGALTAIPAEFSTTVVNASLEDLLAAEYAIDVRVDDTDPATSIACGAIGGPVETGPDGSEIAVGLQERGQSAYSGIAWLQDEEDRTLVRVFLARGLDQNDTAAAPQTAPAAEPAPTATATATAEPAVEEEPQAAATPVVGEVSPLGAGSRVVTTIDVNLRAEPAEDAAVVTILGQGVELEVTGAPVDGWVPVVEPGTGQAGFVSDQFVTIAE
ncbi:MAG: hypothetical protein KY456_12235 [Chloroflexi bacterium]|nr:hypothetical protein [Chloroflexota bacterium]